MINHLKAAFDTISATGDKVDGFYTLVDGRMHIFLPAASPSNPEIMSGQNLTKR